MDVELKNKLFFLAEKYENESFLENDPSQFLRWYPDIRNSEVASFIAAMLSFGNRKQFIPKIKSILNLADEQGGICKWIENGVFEKSFGSSKDKFYRFYSYDDMNCFFFALKKILEKNETFGDFMRISFMQNGISGKAKIINDSRCFNGFDENSFAYAQTICKIMCDAFENCKIVPKGKNSANKRVYMFMRWMVRRNSPVDLGIWQWFDPENLIIPLDTHVVQESEKLGMIKKKSPANLRTALEITNQLKEIWPDDPCKGDFALFGLGVDKLMTD